MVLLVLSLWRCCGGVALVVVVVVALLWMSKAYNRIFETTALWLVDYNRISQTA